MMLKQYLPMLLSYLVINWCPCWVYECTTMHALGAHYCYITNT